MTTPIRHLSCGNIIYWWVGPRHETVAKSIYILDLEGKMPEPYAIASCPYCQQEVDIKDLRRCFEENRYPGFDVEEKILEALETRGLLAMRVPG